MAKMKVKIDGTWHEVVKVVFYVYDCHYEYYVLGDSQPYSDLDHTIEEFE